MCVALCIIKYIYIKQICEMMLIQIKEIRQEFSELYIFFVFLLLI